MRSAGILLWRPDPLEVLIAHPGGPFFAKKDLGAWSVPKGLVDLGEDEYVAACREFQEETGSVVPQGVPMPLGETQLRSNKTVVAWAVQGDFDPTQLVSNQFELEWPPRSGQMQSFPEIDQVVWLPPEGAKRKLHSAQSVFVDRLMEHLSP